MRSGSNARLGQSQYLVAEADESDRSFLRLSPILAVVTNLDREHMDCYRDMADVESAFVEFMERVPFYGACVACVDDALLAAILPRVRRRVFTYGASPQADFVLRLLPAFTTGQHRRSGRPRNAGSRFEVAAGGAGVWAAGAARAGAAQRAECDGGGGDWGATGDPAGGDCGWAGSRFAGWIGASR